MVTHRRIRYGFTLVELLMVLAISSMLAALLFPLFLTARGEARQSVCRSNLRQIGLGITLYQQDSDGYFPHAIGPSTRAWAASWTPFFPVFAAEIPQIPYLQEVLRPYINSPLIFACPADSGYNAVDYPYGALDATPTSYQKFGTSYYYRDILTACHSHDAGIKSPSTTILLSDPVGYWHGTLIPISPRYNALFIDGHVKNLTRTHFEEASGKSLNQWIGPFDPAVVCQQ